MSEFIKHYCNYYNIPNPEDEPEDPFFEELTDKFDYFARDLKTYCMTYSDMMIYTNKSYSYSYLTKKIPEYVENGTLIRYGSKNSAKFVLPKYEQLYINAKKVEPLADLRSFIDPTIYIDKLQLRLLPSNTYGNKLFKERQQFSASNPTKIFGRVKDHYFSFLFYKSGKINIYIDFKSKPIFADLRSFMILFNYLRHILSNYHNSTTLPHSFIISQFEGHREPFDKSFKLKIKTTQSFNLPQLLYYLNNI